MTVKELIEELQKIENKNAKVYYINDEQDYEYVDYVIIDKKGNIHLK